jgi:hypothetical protein
VRLSIKACGPLLALTLGCAVTATAATGAEPSPQRRHAELRAIAYYHGAIRKLREETWYWERVMGVPPSRPGSRRLAAVSPDGLHALHARWRRLERRAFRRAHHPPDLGAWLCIHRYEGSWTDTGGPYYGGLQMSLSFQRTYGGWLLARKGTADHWTPLEQIWTAVRAHRSRGFYPWPSTARFCGLL